RALGGGVRRAQPACGHRQGLARPAHPAGDAMRGGRLTALWRVWLAVLAGIVLAALLAPVLARGGPTGRPVGAALLAPGDGHLLGTGHLGRDVFSRTVWGARNSLGAALLAGSIALAGALIVGSTASMFGGWVDRV